MIYKSYKYDSIYFIWQKTTMLCNHWVLGSLRDHANAMWAARYVGVVRKLHQQEKEEEEEVFLHTDRVVYFFLLRTY